MIDDASEVPKSDPEQFEQTTINPEIAREMAKKLAEKEDQLVELITTQFKGKKHVMIDHHSFYSEFEDGQFGIDCYREPIGRYGSGSISLGFFPNEPYHSAVGVETNYRVTVGMHTDEETMQQFLEEEKRQGGKPQGQTNTMYFFNRDGDYGKVSIFPHSIEDSRPTLMPGHSSKPVVSKMTAGDFEIAGAALQILINRFTPAETA